jgi:hypothetical protein
MPVTDPPRSATPHTAWRRRLALTELARHDRESLLALLAGHPTPLTPAWLRRTWLHWLMQSLDPADVFGVVYEKNIWGNAESRSGAGSTLAETAVVRAALPDLLRELGARTLLDVPCGDFHWMRDVDLTGIDYLGGDIVPALVEANNAAYAAPGRRFRHLDLLADTLPAVDAAMCRDCLVHLPNPLALQALDNLRRSGSRWLLATTFPGTEHNEDILLGHWRPVNLERPPFNLPPPQRLLHEGNPDPRYVDKSLGVWAIADLARGGE